jgi:DNA-binding NarL/FixJ family response regulator
MQDPAGLSQYALLRMLDFVGLRLSGRDVSAMLALVSDLRELDEPEPFPLRLVERLHSVIPSDWVGYSELDPSMRRSLVQIGVNADGEASVGTGHENPDEWWDEWWRVRDTHPSCCPRTATGVWTTVQKVSDFATLREFRRTAIYDSFYRGAVDHWLDFGLSATRTRTRAFLFTRYRRPDFDERDRLVAELLQPHLEARADAVEAALQGAAALAAIEEGGGEAAGSVVLCSENGVIEFASARSRALLAQYLMMDDGRICAGVLGRRRFAAERSERRLHARIAKTGNLYVLLLDESDTRTASLTGRERQILELAGLGKANAAIAFELGIAQATVAKHLEHAYRKLGVPNRTAAAALLDGR